MWEQNLLQESSYHPQTEVLEIAEAGSSPLNELDFVVDTFHHSTGCALVEVVGYLIHPTSQGLCVCEWKSDPDDGQKVYHLPSVKLSR